MATVEQQTSSPQFGGQTRPAALTSEDMLTQGREMALQGVPLQIGGLLSALSQLRARASGSTAANFPQIMGQLSDLRSTYAAASQAISRRLGFAGGGQVEREKGNLLARAGGQYANLLSGAQQEGFSGLLNLTSGVQPQISGTARPAQTSTATRYNPFAGQAAGLLAGEALPIQLRTLWNASGFGQQGDAAYAAKTMEQLRANPAFNPQEEDGPILWQ